MEGEGGQASYEALLRSLQASRQSSGIESGSGSSSDSEGEHAPGGAAEGVRKGSQAKGTPARERERQAACSTEPSRSRAARAQAQLGGAAAESLGATHRAEQLNGARPVAAAAPARRRDGEADDAGAAWNQRVERHFGRYVAVLARAPCPCQHLCAEGRLQRGLLCQEPRWHRNTFLGGYYCDFESVVWRMTEFFLSYVNTLFRPPRVSSLCRPARRITVLHCREVTEEEAEAAGSIPLTERGAAAVRRDAWPHATWTASGPPLSAVSRMYSLVGNSTAWACACP